MFSSHRQIADRITGVLILGLSALVLMDLVLGIGWAGTAARWTVVALTLAVMPQFQLREWALMAMAAALSAALLHVERSGAGIAAAADKGAYFAAFILLMMLLREAAVTSASVLAVGTWITRQPPGRRFLAIWTGGHLAGILMNFGAISLLAPLIQRGIRAEPDATPADRRRREILERRQLSALVRGFAWIMAWAPTTLTQVIILGTIPGLDPGRAILWGLGLTVLMFFVGWGEDRLRWRRRRPAGPVPGAPFPGRAGLDLALVYAALVGGALAIQAAIVSPLPHALMTVAPMVLVLWVLCQNAGQRGGGLAAAGRLAEIAGASVPRMAKDSYRLGAAGFIGVAAARLAPVDAISAWLDGAGIPAWVLVASLPVIVTLGGQIALSPIVLVVFIASVLSSLPVLPAPPEYIAVALGAAWALSMTASPNATGALLITGATGVPPTRLTWIWNGVYSLAVMAVLVVLAWIFVPA